MKSVQVTADLRIENHKEFEAYKNLTKPIIEKFGGGCLAKGGELHVEQSELWAPNRITILTFPGVKKVEAFLAYPQ